MMTKKKFNNFYKDKGGLNQLKKFMKENTSIEIIGEHFGVCKNAVRLWCIEIFGKNYDPRKRRRDKLIDEMIKFAEKNTQDEFRRKYVKKSKYYYHMALARCYTKGIYQK